MLDETINNLKKNLLLTEKEITNYKNIIKLISDNFINLNLIENGKAISKALKQFCSYFDIDIIIISRFHKNSVRIDFSCEYDNEKNISNIKKNLDIDLIEIAPNFCKQLEKDNPIYFEDNLSEKEMIKEIFDLNDNFVSVPIFLKNILYGFSIVEINFERKEINYDLIKFFTKNIFNFLEMLHSNKSLDKTTEQIEKINNDLLQTIKQLEEEKAWSNKMAQSAKKSNNLKTDFIANMSHEIRTPMNGIVGMMGLIMSSGLNDDQKEYANIIIDCSTTLMTIINDLLDFSKIESGDLELEETTFDLNRAISITIDILKLKAKKNKLELIYKFDNQLPNFVIGDPGRTRQILMNLIDNAIKFTKKGKIEVNVQLLNKENTNIEVLFSVKDTGIGIAKNKIDNIFSSFTQADQSRTREYGGTGIGLSISKDLTDLMKGKLWVESEEGIGTTFFLKLPYEETSILYESAEICSEDIKSKKILIVDNNFVNRNYIEKVLNKIGYNTTIAENSNQAIELLDTSIITSEIFDIAIVDMNLKEISGEELGKYIKNNNDFKDMELILITDMGQRGDAIRFKKIGFSGYLTRPINKVQIESCLGAIVNKIKSKDLTDEFPLITKHSITEEIKKKVVILVAEDNPTNQKVAKHILKNLGYQSDTVSNGKEVIDVLEKKEYNLIIMDIKMPVMSGLEATKKIRSSNKRYKNIPIIALTALVFDEDKKNVISSGMNDYLSKPIQPDQLNELIEKYLFN